MQPARLPKEDDMPTGPTGDPAIAEQTRILTAALERLREARDPAGALALCDRFAERFPNGVVAPEIGRVRVDALLALGKRKRALEALERLALDGLPRGAELRVLRGELRLEAGRAKEALEDFEAALPQVSGDVAARARAGRDEARGKVSGAVGHTGSEPGHEVRP
jgi:tetratricopeptide (TPR) repeat protein